LLTGRAVCHVGQSSLAAPFSGIFRAMRLEKIKLAGFKSFVDPTTVPFPSNLVGIVGPNGCGKSNVIDAVRWVMGESSAKMLRGQSMADVIFNGSSGRKPVGTAGIEMVFDNSDGAAGGEYAKYAQISVKRQVSRDGQSAYYLNGSRCRRRDIQDLFLGTGLGPRSYSIIEQGMVSRLIEAKPEDLRLFLEEAAGISKYKERRRETETRMRNTQENLDRLTDLRDEVAKQLAHLERQAAVAEKYQKLKAQQRLLDSELKALRWRALDTEILAQDRELAEQDNRVEAEIARQRRLEADIEASREAYTAASEGFNQVQGRFYAVGSEIARLEQAIQYARETRSRLETELARLGQELEGGRVHLERDTQLLAELATGLSQDEPALTKAQQALNEATAQVVTAEAAQAAWERDWDEFNQAAAAPAQRAQVERARINHLESRIDQERQRGQRLAAELGRLDKGDLADRIEVLLEQEEDLAEQLDTADSDQAQAREALSEVERQTLILGEALDAARTELQQARGRHASLAALQEAALTDPDAGLGDWLRASGLAGAARLIDHLDVDPGWGRALEVVLADHLGALCSPDLDGHGRAAGNSAPSAITLFDAASRVGPMPGPDALLAKVRCPWPLQGLLGGVRIAEDLAAALAQRGDLGPGERIVTRDAVLVGADWVRIPGSGAALDGAIARGEEVRALAREIADLEAKATGLAASAEGLATTRQDADAARAQSADDLARINRELSAVRSDLAAKRSRQEQQNERRAALEAEIEELAEARVAALEEMEEARERLHADLEAIEDATERREALAERRGVLREALTAARAAEQSGRERAQALAVGCEAKRAARTATERSLERAKAQQVQAQERREEIVAALEDLVEPLAERQELLSEQLEQRVEVEAELAAARDRMEQIDASVRALEQERSRVEQTARERARSLDELRLARQEGLVRRRTLEEQLAESQQTPPEILAGLAPEADEMAWAEELSKVEGRIQRLGAINLAAIDEYQEQSERKRYLDAQHEDIARSLETLEGAIRKIDRETRGRFKDTYDQVNQGFQALFPRLFGGGNAYLELTGEDLLETGVTVMARPPGKRNSSIHLLSGGEKALTAVALVFAIFQLNPAPFCMLDEVDAPLDDANVGRFCELVRSMSAQVQFIFITHNKVTMEISDHLLGVTMHEPGVSRLVAVDVEAAAALAGAA
jgi:chromosome segregation protein